MSCMTVFSSFFLFFFFNDTATTEIYTLSLHDALPISTGLQPDDLARYEQHQRRIRVVVVERLRAPLLARRDDRSEEHTSELQSRPHLVCRLLLEKKKKKSKNHRAAPTRASWCPRRRAR